MDYLFKRQFASLCTVQKHVGIFRDKWGQNSATSVYGKLQSEGLGAGLNQ